MEEQPLDFSSKKYETTLKSPTSLPPFTQIFHQQEFIPVVTDFPQTIDHHPTAASVKSEDEESEILDLSMGSTEDQQLMSTSIGLYEQMFQRIESCFNGIREEIKHRNQIESQRVAVEIAKFKYLHPYFSFDV